MGDQTDEIRLALDERGTQHSDHDYGKARLTFWDSPDGYPYSYTTHPGDLLEETFGTGTLRHVTPEQAIAATLDDGDYEGKMDALLCRLTNGKLSKTRAYSIEVMEQAIAEEFERTTDIDARACEYEFVPNIGAGILNACGLRCKSCGREQMSLIPPNYCPDCGARVAKVVRS